MEALAVYAAGVVAEAVANATDLDVALFCSCSLVAPVTCDLVELVDRIPDAEHGVHAKEHSDGSDASELAFGGVELSSIPDHVNDSCLVCHEGHGCASDEEDAHEQ